MFDDMKNWFWKRIGQTVKAKVLVLGLLATGHCAAYGSLSRVNNDELEAAIPVKAVLSWRETSTNRVDVAVKLSATGSSSTSKLCQFMLTRYGGDNWVMRTQDQRRGIKAPVDAMLPEPVNMSFGSFVVVRALFVAWSRARRGIAVTLKCN